MPLLFSLNVIFCDIAKSYELERPKAFLCATVFNPLNVPGFKAKKPVYLTRDILDWSRGFGTKYFLDSDPMWKDPEYLKQFIELATPSLTSYFGKPEALLSEFALRLSRLGQGSIARLTTTGSQANNMMIQAARHLFQNRHPNVTAVPKIIYLNYIYGGSFGEIAQIKNSQEKEFNIWVPTISPRELRTIFNENQLTSGELQALATIEQRQKEHPVAGIFMEPFPINGGASVYSPGFLRALRELADRLQLPILADEVLSGVGRTGYFWSFQYVEGFCPDLISFGKGLVVAGVFAPDARKMFSRINDHFYGGPSETLMSHPVALLQAIQVLKALEDRKIMEQIKATGRHLERRAAQIVEKDPRFQSKFNVMGTIVSNAYFQNLLPSGLVPESTMGRYNLPYTITKTQIDAIFGLKPFIFEDIR